MSEKRQAQRWRGYLQVAIQSSRGRAPGHILELSRTGGLLSTQHPMREGEPFRIELRVDKKFEQLTHAPDVLVLEAVARRGDSGGSFGAEHIAFAFTNDTVVRYWPWLDALAPHYGMRPSAPAAPPPPPPPRRA
jgi:hypothetical protein